VNGAVVTLGGGEGRTMTERQWAACKNVSNMLQLLGRKASERKLRLFAAACCRRVWHHLTDERSRRAVELAERLADGEATTKERAAAARSARRVSARYRVADTWYAVAAAGYATESRAWGAAYYAAEAVARQAGQTKARPGEEKAQAALLRDIFNPFCPVTISPAWQSPQVIGLAQATYDERELPAGTLDTARLAVLADALEDAGCTNADILNHCRRSGVHVRGCWVVDLLLGKV
jgi:hypothetical protein